MTREARSFLIQDMLVIDAASIYPRFACSGALYALDIVDGATIKPLIGEDGRAPAPPDPAYQQVLHGVPAADFSADELLYVPRNLRSHRLYGFPPVEQIALTVNIALRREQATLDYHNTGSIPDCFATLPKEWTVDQRRQLQDYFDAPGKRNRLPRDGGQSGAPAHIQIHAAGVQADRDASAAAEGHVRRMAGAGDLLRLLGSGLGVHLPSQPRDFGNAAGAGDDGRAG